MVPVRKDAIRNALAGRWIPPRQWNIRIDRTPLGDAHAGVKIARIVARTDVTRLRRMFSDLR